MRVHSPKYIKDLIERQNISYTELASVLHIQPYMLKSWIAEGNAERLENIYIVIQQIIFARRERHFEDKKRGTHRSNVWSLRK